MDKYFRECYKIPSRRIYLDSESANIITNRGDCIFQLNNTISLPDDVICYVQLNEMVMPNTDYNIDSNNIHSILLILMVKNTILVFLLEIIMLILYALH